MDNPLSPSPHGEGSGVRFKITVLTLLEEEATDTDRSIGLDIADYIIEEMTSQRSCLRFVRKEKIRGSQTEDKLGIKVQH